MSLQQASMKHKHFLNTQDWSRSELDALLTLAEQGCHALFAAQRAALAE